MAERIGWAPVEGSALRHQRSRMQHAYSMVEMHGGLQAHGIELRG